MIADQTCERGLQNGSQLEVETFGGFAEFILIMPSHTTHERDRQVRTVIGLNMITQEVNKVIDYDGSDTSIIKVIADKLGKGSQKAIGQRLTINTLDNLWQIQAGFFLKHRLDFL